MGFLYLVYQHKRLIKLNTKLNDHYVVKIEALYDSANTILIDTLNFFDNTTHHTQNYYQDLIKLKPLIHKRADFGDKLPSILEFIESTKQATLYMNTNDNTEKLINRIDQFSLDAEPLILEYIDFANAYNFTLSRFPNTILKDLINISTAPLPKAEPASEDDENQD